MWGRNIGQGTFHCIVKLTFTHELLKKRVLKAHCTNTIAICDLRLSMKMQFVMINDMTKKKCQHYLPLKSY